MSIEHKRLSKNNNREKIEESNYLIVPGVRLFNTDYLYKWLRGYNGYINLSLFFYKFPRWFKGYDNSGKLKEIGLSHKFYVPKPRTHDYKREHLEDVVSLSKEPPNYDALKKRYFFNEGHCFTLQTKTRLIVGFSGGNSVLEVGLSLHPLYGFPIIPGSALKGVARHYCKENGINKNLITDIFGTEDDEDKEKEKKEGNVIFMDAWPEKWPEEKKSEDGILTLDIMTPHYQNYYQNKKHRKPPSDDENPVPIPFITVNRGIEFRFCILPTLRCDDESLVEKAKKYLILALKEYGIGAKTGSSYGYFEEVGGK